MKICWLGPYLPARGGSGSDLRSFHLIKGLSEAGHALEGRFLGAHGREAEPFFDSLEIFEPSRTMRYLRAIGGGITGTPFSYGRFFHPDLWPRENSYDWIYLDHLHMCVNLPPSTDSTEHRVWLDEHNLEFRLWEAYAEQFSPIPRMAARWESRRVFRYEVEILEQVDGFSIPSHFEKELLPDQLGSHGRVIPNGVDPEWLDRGRDRIGREIDEIGTLGFIGGFDWKPNRQGIERFLSNRWPALRQQFPDLRLLLAGRNPRAAWSSSPGVDTPGFVEDIDAFYDRIDMMIVPLEIGAGTRVKVLEAMARGIPVRGTDRAVEGIKGEAMMGAGDMDGLESAIRDDLESPDRLEDDRDRAYEIADENYRWPELASRLHRRLEEGP